MLLAELTDYPGASPHPEVSSELNAVLMPMRLKTPRGELSLISTTTVFGTPRDVVLSEIAIETLFLADAATRDILGASLRSTGTARN